MSQALWIDGRQYEPENLSDAARNQLSMIRFVDSRIAEFANIKALMTRAKKSYIDGLEREIIKARSGVDVASLLSD